MTPTWLTVDSFLRGKLAGETAIGALSSAYHQLTDQGDLDDWWTQVQTDFATARTPAVKDNPNGLTEAEAVAGTGTTPKKLSAAVLAAGAAEHGGGGGGSPVYPSSVIYVDTYGNDTTGDGSAAAPYATAQKAFDVVLNDQLIQFGVGQFGNVTMPPGIETFYIRGLGETLSILGVLTLSGNTVFYSDRSVKVTAIQGIGANGIDGPSHTESAGVGEVGGNGYPGKDLSLFRVYAAAVNLNGGAGGDGGNGGSDGNGGNGGNSGSGGGAGQFYMEDSRVDALSLISGQPGTPGTGDSNGLSGDVGGSGTVTIIRSIWFASPTSPSTTPTVVNDWSV